MLRDPSVSRRTALRILGGTGVAAATNGLAGAEDGEGDDRQRFNVGTPAPAVPGRPATGRSR